MISVAKKTGSIIRLLAGICMAVALSHAGLLRAQAPTPSSAGADLVHIRADNMKYDIKSGVSSYTGNVHITHSGMELIGDTVTVKQQNSEIEQLVVTGKPARYHQTADNGDTITAESLEMTYSTRLNQLILTDKARLEQAGHIVESQRIIYDTVQEVVIAGQINPTDRVNITLTPKKVTPKPDAEDGR
jgi:lipopolysaccharide export system protein LptA